jgi:hypothetical protein
METTNTTQPLNLTLVKKMSSSERIKVSFTDTKSKVEFKNKGHKEGRMKITLKFGKDESEGFLNFCRLAKPDNMGQDDFVKFLFYKGVQALQQDFAQKVEDYKKEHPEEFAKVQAEMDEVMANTKGSVTVAEEAPKL